MSAVDEIQGQLDQFGLGSLANWAWQRYQDGASMDQIMREVYTQPDFKAAFPEYDVLAQKGRAYSVAELVAYRKAVSGIMNQYGIPSAMTTNDLFSKLAANEVSVAEVSQRVAGYAQAAFSSPPETRKMLEDYYGVTPGELVGFFMDPEKSQQIIQQRYLSAQIGGAAAQTGYNTLTQHEAETLAGQGVTDQQAQQGFGTLAKDQELFGALNAGEQNISQATQLGAAFGGNAEDQQTIDKRKAQRSAEFQQGGGFAQAQGGIVGVGQGKGS